ncbi:MAG: hypothetical protein JWM21_750 [Acidobacteria bacterium]|nr:hypothetical protein [Acidobacteriota bacterium]
MRLEKLLLGCLLLVGAGCSKSAPPTAGTVPPSTTPGASAAPAASAPSANTTSTGGTAPGVGGSRNIVDACALLTSKDLQAVQGEALKETKPSSRADGGFMISQCFYTLPTFTNSISLLVAQRGESAGARDPKEFWQETFHRSDEADSEKERAKEKEKGKAKDQDNDKDKAGRGEEEERAVPPQKIADVGDEAFWTGNRVGGALYALKGNTYIRVSIGGPGDQAAKIKKAKALAQIILKRL